MGIGLERNEIIKQVEAWIREAGAGVGQRLGRVPQAMPAS